MNVEFFKNYKKGLHFFGESISAIVSSVLLTFVYIVGVGCTAVVARVARKRFIDYNLDKKTFWKEVDSREKTKEEYLRQF
ncbi:hypothetical protein KKH43_03680 [Patescibacteria group bacterium]|nr:hypothetical protein [Patescibacteria group bacterium]